jgi:hypothetical protein
MPVSRFRFAAARSGHYTRRADSFCFNQFPLLSLVEIGGITILGKVHMVKRSQKRMPRQQKFGWLLSHRIEGLFSIKARSLVGAMQARDVYGNDPKEFAPSRALFAHLWAALRCHAV